MATWIIAPFSSDHPKAFDDYWADGLKRGYISIGWGDRNPTGLSEKAIVRQLGSIAKHAPRAANTIFRFMNEIQQGDTVIARKGMKEIVGIGTVTSRKGYYHSTKCSRIGDPHDDLHMLFIDVAWDSPFNRIRLNRIHFTRTTAYTPKEGSLPMNLIRRLANRIPQDALRDFAEVSVNEGKPTQRLHVYYERSSALARKRKERDRYICKACDGDYATNYDGQFQSVVQAHHLIPLNRLASSKALRKTTIHDLVTLCPTCHSMIHKLKGREHDVEGLRAIIAG